MRSSLARIHLATSPCLILSASISATVGGIVSNSFGGILTTYSTSLATRVSGFTGLCPQPTKKIEATKIRKYFIFVSL